MKTAKYILKLSTLWSAMAFSNWVSAQVLTLEDIFLSREFYPESPGTTHFLNTSSRYSLLTSNEAGDQLLNVYDITSGELTGTLLNTADWPELGAVEDYQFSEDDRMILLSSGGQRIYRHSTRAFHHVLDTEHRQLHPLDDNLRQMYPHFSPCNTMVGYLQGNDLFYRDLLTGTSRQVSRDGREHAIINGRPDWVYEEEFALKRMYEWSRDGSWILYARFDEREVPEFNYMVYEGLYPRAETFKYPRAGERNSEVTLMCYNVRRDTLVRVNIPYDYEYIPRIIRAGEGFAFLLFNRHQDHLRAVEYLPAADSFRLVFESRDDRYVDEPSVFEYIGEGEYIMLDDSSGYLHLWQIGPEGATPLTSGDHEITAYYGMDTAGWFYYQSSEMGPEQRHIYRQNRFSGHKEQLTDQAGTHSANFAGDHSCFVHTRSAKGIPPVISVRDKLGVAIRSLETNNSLHEKIGPWWSAPEFFEIPTGSHSIPAWLIRPPDFNPDRKYPVFHYIYGGPGNQRVRDQYSSFDLWFQLLAQQGYVVLCTDNRGTPGRGSAYKKANYLDLGGPEVADQLQVIEYLAKQPWADTTRLGYYGWSYGGYMALMMLFKGGGAVKAAVSVAPVTDWRLYDTIYTERYMRTPSENPDGYRSAGPIHHVDSWKRGRLLLAHGTADDNVHFQNSAELIKVMSRLGKHYELYIYPDGGHGMGSSWNRYHLFSKITDFIMKNL